MGEGMMMIEEGMSEVDIKIFPVKMECLPKYETEHASGMDFKARLDESVIIHPGERKLVPTGLFVEIPVGFEIQVRPRSGLALKHGITVNNSPGTIDSELMV
jgi:dUTP pyrophosphatase